MSMAPTSTNLVGPVHQVHRRMTQELLNKVESKTRPTGEDAVLSADRYIDSSWFDREMSTVFRRQPLLVAHSSELRDPGQCVTFDHYGVSAIIVRGEDGIVRAFANACRHRGTRLLQEPAAKKKGFVCPYHKWSYDLSGRLRGLPHKNTFTTIKCGVDGLTEFPVAEGNGMVWLVPDREVKLELDAHLGPIAAEFDALSLGEHVVHRKFECERHANWKLVIDAFLEAYHIKTLHRDTLARFFMDAQVQVEPVGQHLRAVTARKRILEGRTMPAELWPIRQFVTPSYILFPNTVVIVHPDYVSLITLIPLAADRCRWVHRMLIPKPAETDAERAHWDKTLQLIEQTVFQREDLHVAELIQQGLAARARDTVTFGQLEQGVPMFHQTLVRAMNEA